MTTYTHTDAKIAPIVARALDNATALGGLPRITFGGGIEACLTTTGHWQINARAYATPNHPTMFTTYAHAATTPQAVELITKIAREQPVTIGEVKRARQAAEAANTNLRQLTTEAITTTGNLASVARAAGITRATAYRWAANPTP